MPLSAGSGGRRLARHQLQLPGSIHRLFSDPRHQAIRCLARARQGLSASVHGAADIALHQVVTSATAYELADVVTSGVIYSPLYWVDLFLGNVLDFLLETLCDDGLEQKARASSTPVASAPLIVCPGISRNARS